MMILEDSNILVVFKGLVDCCLVMEGVYFEGCML